jgi:glycosyltransferase involved in cell wall biosynthesis
VKAFFLRTEYFSGITEGGSLAVTNGFLTGLQQLGHDGFVAANRRLPIPAGMTCYEISYSPFFRNLPEVLFLPYNARVVRMAKQIIEKEKPDFLYHRHHSFNYAGALLKRDLGIPFILQVEGSEVWVKHNWGKVYFDKLLQWAEDIQFGYSDAIVVISSVLKNQLVSLGVPPEKITVIPNGVDADKYSPSVDGSSIRKKYNLDGKLVCGYTGTFGQWHGITVLAEAVKFVVKKNPNVIFLLIGDGVLRGEVEDILRRDGVWQNVIITGMMQHQAVPQHLAACDALVLPAIDNPDGLGFFQSPIKLFEYMAMGKAVISSDVGQPKDIIQSGTNGLLVHQQNAAELAEKILMLADDHALCQSLGSAARRDAVEKYSWKQNAQQVLDVYARIKRNAR